MMHEKDAKSAIDGNLHINFAFEVGECVKGLVGILERNYE